MPDKEKDDQWVSPRSSDQDHVEDLPDPAAPSDDKTEFDDAKTDELVDEIAAKEGDEVLAAQDAASDKAGLKVPKKENFFKRWWNNKWARWITIGLLVAGLVALFIIPSTRYWILNTLGVRASSSLTAVDSATQLPLKGVKVQIGDKEATTDSEGVAKLTDLKLGPQQLKIEKTGFAEIDRQITIGWGSNPLGNVPLTATGVQYVIEVRDYLSEKPIEGATAVSGESAALSDKNGKITLTMPAAAGPNDSVTLSKDGYRTEQMTLNADADQSTQAIMVPARKAVFVSRSSGKYDVYKSDLDGKNRELLLAATGNETSNLSLAVSPDGSRAALVSTRDGKPASGGGLLSSVVLINVADGSSLSIAEGPQITLIDWVGPRLVFEVVSSDVAAENHYTVTSYNMGDGSRLQLAAANRLNAVRSAQGVIYYAVGLGTDVGAQLGLFKINPDGSGKQRVTESEIVTLLRTTYSAFALQLADGSWQAYDIPSSAVSGSGLPASLTSRSYADNSGRSKSLWVNQGSLISYDIASAKDTAVKTQSGLAYPVYWLSASAAVYRVAGGETADYAVDVGGGSAHKVADVTSTFGLSP